MEIGRKIGVGVRVRRLKGGGGIVRLYGVEERRAFVDREGPEKQIEGEVDADAVLVRYFCQRKGDYKVNHRSANFRSIERPLHRDGHDSGGNG